MPLQTCTKCSIEKDLETDFYKDKSRKLGHKHICIDCHKATTSYWQKTFPEKRTRQPRAVANKNRNVRKAGISIAAYEAVLEFQKEVCAICGGVNPSLRLAIDIDPKTRRLRGLLCQKCLHKVRNLEKDPGRIVLISVHVNNSAVKEIVDYILDPPYWRQIA